MSEAKNPGQDEAIAFLAAPTSHGAAKVERIDTHGAVVFLVGDRAYKLKRAVAFSYMDFSTVAKREAACRAELTLNRRSAPELYLSVQAIRRHLGATMEGGDDLAQRDDHRVVQLAALGKAVEQLVLVELPHHDDPVDRLALAVEAERSVAATADRLDR